MDTGNREGDKEWRWEIDLPAESASARRARGFVSTAAEMWGRPELASGAGLCATELVTNVLIHTDCTACRLAVSYQHDRLLIEVHDDSPKLPSRSTEAVEAEHGRGLQIVEAVASEWGIVSDTHSGKSIWVRMGASGETGHR